MRRARRKTRRKLSSKGRRNLIRWGFFTFSAALFGGFKIWDNKLSKEFIPYEMPEPIPKGEAQDYFYFNPYYQGALEKILTGDPVG